MNRRGLGRGLGALIPEMSAPSGPDADRVHSLPVTVIQPNPAQPRKEFRPDEITELAESIRQQGLLQPVVVRRVAPDRFELIAGERRWRAVRHAGFDQIPAIVRDTSDDEMLPLALVENLMREDLNPIEEAEAYRRLQDEAGWTQEAIASQVGKGRAHVANTLRLLKLPRDIQAELAVGELTVGHARTLLACETEKELRELRERIRAQGLTVREAESRVPRAEPRKPRKRKTGSRTKRARVVSAETRDLEERLQRVYGTPVQIHERAGRGRVSLEFYSYEDLDRLLDLLYAAESRTGESSRR